MNNRVRSFWIPSLVTFGATSILLMSIQRLGIEPRVFWYHGLANQVYLPWLIALPLCGAAGVYLSRRAGGPLRASLMSGLFPAIVMLVLLCLVLLVSVFVEQRHFTIWFLTAFLITVCNWVLVPALALSIGAAPASSLGLHKQSRAASTSA